MDWMVGWNASSIVVDGGGGILVCFGNGFVVILVVLRLGLSFDMMVGR